MYTKKPDWLKIKIQSGGNQVRELLKDYSLNTVCNEAGCPNQMECFKNHTATFMILGKNCTRNCTFCKVTKDKPEPVNPQEPHNIAKAVDILNLNHVVITSVTRDDLKDGGSSQFVKVIEEITKLNKDISIEVLIPDFKGDFEALKSVVNAKPEIINHNVETVPSLYEEVRPLAVYERSLEVLENVKKLDPSIYTKSGFMLGLGEKKEDVISLMKDLRNVDCDFLTIGQYLAPSTKHHKVIEYVHPDVFKEYEEIGLDLGFKSVFSGPLVRSSYRASECFSKVK